MSGDVKCVICGQIFTPVAKGQTVCDECMEDALGSTGTQEEVQHEKGTA